MAQRGGPLSAIQSLFNYIARATVQAADDSKKWQEITHKVFQGEQADTIEHVHEYGFTSVPKPPDSNGTAEAIVNYVGGDRSHGVAIVVGDRRYRLTNLQNGEVAIHDDQGQKVHLTRSGIVVNTNGTLTITAAGNVAINAPNIALNGNVFLGGAVGSGVPISLQGTLDTAGTPTSAIFRRR